MWFTEQVLLIRSQTGNLQFADVSLQRGRSGIIQSSGSKRSQIVSNPALSVLKHNFDPSLGPNKPEPLGVSRRTPWS